MYQRGTLSYTATVTAVASATAATILSQARASKLGVSVFNDSTSALYLKMGEDASATDHSVTVAAGGYFEVPFNYTGVITGAWETANGNARVTEYA